MRFPSLHSGCALFFGLAMFSSVSVWAQLSAHSPFLPAQGGSAAATTAGPLEFGGFLDSPTGERLYRVKDSARKVSEWVKLNERSPTLNVIARKFNEGDDTLTLDYNGQSMTLAKREAKILSSGNVPQVMPMAMSNIAPGMPPGVTQGVVANPTPADEQKRLEAVAAEVARRRALREQATTQVNQGMVPQVVQPQAQAQRNAQQNGQNRGLPQQNQQQQGARKGGRQQR